MFLGVNNDCISNPYKNINYSTPRVLLPWRCAVRRCWNVSTALRWSSAAGPHTRSYSRPPCECAGKTGLWPERVQKHKQQNRQLAPQQPLVRPSSPREGVARITVLRERLLSIKYRFTNLYRTTTHFKRSIPKSLYILTEEIFFFYSVCSSCSNYWPDCHETWWKGVLWATKGPIKCWSISQTQGKSTQYFSLLVTLQNMAFGLGGGPNSREFPSSFHSFQLRTIFRQYLILKTRLSGQCFTRYLERFIFLRALTQFTSSNYTVSVEGKWSYSIIW